MTDTAYTAPPPQAPAPHRRPLAWARIVRTAIEERIDADAFNDNLAQEEELAGGCPSQRWRMKSRD